MEAVGTLLTATVVVHISPANPDFCLARSVLVTRHAMFSQKIRSNRLRFENLLSSQVAFGLIHVRQEAFLLHAAFVILRHVFGVYCGISCYIRLHEAVPLAKKNPHMRLAYLVVSVVPI
jgi:hypothetical protein